MVPSAFHPFLLWVSFVFCYSQLTNVVIVVMYIVDIRRGIYYQKCYDPDCRGVYYSQKIFLKKKHSESRILSNTTCLLSFSLADYRSPIRPVPDSYLPEDIVYDQGEAQNVSNNLYLEGESYIDNEREPDSASSRDSWWLEAAKIADDLESKPKALEPHTLVSLLNHFYSKEQQSVMFLT